MPGHGPWTCDPLRKVMSSMQKRLYKTEGKDAMLCGVCGGIAEYFNVDPTLVRVGWVILAFAASVGFWAYLVCAIIMPKKSNIFPL